MNKNINLKKLLIFGIIIFAGTLTIVLSYFGIKEYQNENKLRQAINSVSIDGSYKLVRFNCGNEELKQKCEKGFYAAGDIKKIEADTISKLNQLGFSFEKLPAADSGGPFIVYRTFDSGREFYIRFSDSKNQAYLTGMGNIQLSVY